MIGDVGSGTEFDDMEGNRIQTNSSIFTPSGYQSQADGGNESSIGTYGTLHKSTKDRDSIASASRSSNSNTKSNKAEIFMPDMPTGTNMTLTDAGLEGSEAVPEETALSGEFALAGLDANAHVRITGPGVGSADRDAGTSSRPFFGTRQPWGGMTPNSSVARQEKVMSSTAQLENARSRLHSTASQMTGKETAHADRLVRTTSAPGSRLLWSRSNTRPDRKTFTGGNLREKKGHARHARLDPVALPLRLEMGAPFNARRLAGRNVAPQNAAPFGITGKRVGTPDFDAVVGKLPAPFGRF
eukprot:g4182.t1